MSFFLSLSLSCFLETGFSLFILVLVKFLTFHLAFFSFNFMLQLITFCMCIVVMPHCFISGVEKIDHFRVAACLFSEQVLVQNFS